MSCVSLCSQGKCIHWLWLVYRSGLEVKAGAGGDRKGGWQHSNLSFCHHHHDKSAFFFLHQGVDLKRIQMQIDEVREAIHEDSLEKNRTQHSKCDLQKIQNERTFIQ